MRILLIRHAEPDYTVDSLTPKGRVEAELLSRRMAGYDIRDYYVSPLGRARDTAAYTLEKTGREAEVLPWLKEFSGKYPDPETGKLRLAWDIKPRIWNEYPGVFDIHTWLENPLFDEGNFRQVWQETVDGVDALMARYGYEKDGPVWRCDKNTGDTIALFCHFGISMAVAGYMMDMSPMVLWHRTLTLPTSVTELVTEERIRGEVSFRMTRLGDITHLEAAGEPRSTAGLFPECYTGIDSTDPAVNGTR
ncbi:MAG: histidine phosphatase family protein [Clostridiales bacterium]|nr:histidine phosphatase family protein [Clostridiales bacterium]